MSDESGSGRSKVTTLRAAQIGAIAGAYLLTRWAGWALLWPVILGLAAFWLLRQLGRRDRTWLIPVLAVQAGEIGWELLGVLFTGKLQLVLFDAALAGVGMLWLYARPTLRVVYALVLFFLIEAGYKVYQLVELPTNPSVAGITANLSSEQLAKGLVVHLVLQIITLGLLMGLGKRLSESHPEIAAPPNTTLVDSGNEPKRLL